MAVTGSVPLRAAEFGRRARARLDPVMRPLGFRRAPGVRMVHWARPQHGGWLVIVIQHSDTNGVYPAFRFTVELSVDSTPKPYRGARTRLWELLTATERAEVWAMERRTMERLPPPDPGLLADTSELSRWLLAEHLLPKAEPYAVDADVWFRHADDEDVGILMDFLARVLPEAVVRFEAFARDVAPGRPGVPPGPDTAAATSLAATLVGHSRA